MVHNPGGDCYWEGGQPKSFVIPKFAKVRIVCQPPFMFSGDYIISANG